MLAGLQKLIKNHMFNLIKNNKKKILIALASILAIFTTISLVILTLGFFFFKNIALPFSDKFGEKVNRELTVLFAPLNQVYEGEDFYTIWSGYDFSRIPLADPYYMINLNGDWITYNKEEQIGFGYESMAYNKEYIILFQISDRYERDTETSLPVKAGENMPFWKVIKSDTKEIQNYESESEFNTFLDNSDIEKIEFKSLDEWYAQLVKDGYLPWFPEEYKR